MVNLNHMNRWYFTLVAVVTLSCAEPEKHTPIAQENDKLFSIVSVDHSNLEFTNTVRQTQKNNHMINAEFISGAGVAVGDINNDGLPDIFFTGNQVSDKLFLNKGDLKFEDITKNAGISKDKDWSAGVTFVDIDADGDQDIYVCRNVYLEDEKSANQLYINNGNLTFVEKAQEFGLADRGFSVQAVFFDMDNDGLIDMYLVNQPPSVPGTGGQLNQSMSSNRLFSDKLFKNNGAGRFIDVSDQSNIRNFAFGLSVSAGDLNNDGWIDLYVTNDFDVPDHMYMNQRDGTFKDEIFQAAKHISNFSMGSDISDYDNDGNLDIVVVDMMAEDHKRIKTHMGSMKPQEFWKQVNEGKHYQYMFNTLQRNNGNGTFSDLAQLAGVTSTDWSWAPLFVDFDNDGYKDLFITNGVKSNNRLSDLTDLYDRKLDSIKQVAKKRGMDPQRMINVMDFAKLAPTDKLANYIYRNNGDHTFSKKTEEWGMNLPTLSNGAAYADFDLDGDIDLVINNIDDNALLYKNNAVEEGIGNFLRFKLNPSKDQQIYGTKVTLYKDDLLWQVFQLSNARGYMSKSEDIVHFGVGDVKQVDKVVIEWHDGGNTILKDVAVNQLHEVFKSENEEKLETPEIKGKERFKNVMASLNLQEVAHQENEFDDYTREILLPHKMSQFGPCIGVGDVNGDGLEDFFLGGAAGYSGALYVQNSKDKFDEMKTGAWNQDKASEDMGIVFLDIDGDKDQDLFIVSGGNEFDLNDPDLQDRLYINNGRGKFQKSISGLPKYLTSGSCAIPNDFDKDGDIDLFVGGRLIPGKYPHAANSHLLENRGGEFVDVSKDVAPGFQELGMVTSADWLDYNKDGMDDLVVVGEWMPVTIFVQRPNGQFEKEILDGLEDSEGWYYSVKADDLDGDGDEDIVVGNLGLNYKYKASTEEPFEVYSYDFDNNGSLDIVLSYYEHGEAFPVRGKSCSTQQIPSIGEKFETYEKFGESNLQDVYGSSLNTALNLQAKTFASAYIENLGNDSFEIRNLPSLAQTSSINTILINDYDNDGKKDLLVSGNLYPAEIETPRNDAGTGLLLKGDGKGNFMPISISETGFFTPNDVKDMKTIKVGNKEVILVANNDDLLQAIEFKSPVAGI